MNICTCRYSLGVLSAIKNRRVDPLCNDSADEVFSEIQFFNYSLFTCNLLQNLLVTFMLQMSKIASVDLPNIDNSCQNTILTKN